MKDWNSVPENFPIRALTRVLETVALLFAASASLVMFVALPLVLLDKWHLLPGRVGFVALVLMLPIVAAWENAGFYFLLITVSCELVLVLLRPSVRKARIQAVAVLSICALTYFFLYLSIRFNFN